MTTSSALITLELTATTLQSATGKGLTGFSIRYNKPRVAEGGPQADRRINHRSDLPQFTAL
jgi:hypothetical protein